MRPDRSCPAPLTAADVLEQSEAATVVTHGPEHEVVIVNHAATLLWGARLEPGRPVGATLTGPDADLLLEALDHVYRDAGPRPLLLPGGQRAECTPLRDTAGAVAGVVVRCGGPTTEGAGPDRVRWLALQRLAADLSSAATPAAVGILTITEAARLLGADGAAVYTPVHGPDGRPEALEVAHATGWPAATTKGFQTLQVRAGRPLSDAVLSGEPIWLEDPEQWRARYPEMAPLGTSSGFRATACLPLRVEGRDLGAVVFSFLRSRVFGPDEREYLVATAALCAQALDRARLLVAERSARAAAEAQRDRMAFLARAGALMEAPLSVEQRLQQLADLAVPEVADWCAVHLLREGRVDRIAVAHNDPGKVSFVEQLQVRYPADPDTGSGAVAVARSGRPLLLTEIPDDMLVAAAVDDTHLELIRAIGMRSAVVVPLLVRGRSLGALTLVHAESGQRFTADDLDFVGQLASVAAVALDNARLYEQQREVAHTLQTALLPPRLPDVPGMQVAARYRPQSADLDDFYVGGDLYDVLGPAASGDGSWSAVIGDVCGKGPAAAALTALIRHTWRAEVRHGHDPVAVVEGVNTALLSGPAGETAHFATLIHARLRVDSCGATVDLVGAGHPPPLLVGARAVEYVPTTGTLLGVFPDLALSATAVRLRPGESLVLYTDGVTEARRGAPNAADFYGAERLTALVERHARDSADDIADALLEDVTRFQDDRLHDDVAVLVLRVAP